MNDRKKILEQSANNESILDPLNEAKNQKIMPKYRVILFQYIYSVQDLISHFDKCQKCAICAMNGIFKENLKLADNIRILKYLEKHTTLRAKYLKVEIKALIIKITIKEEK